MQRSMQRGVITFAAAILALFALHYFWETHKRSAGYDFFIFYVAGQLAVRDDVVNIYSAETQERIGEEYFERGRRSGSEIYAYDAARRRRLDNVSSPFLYSALRWVSRDYDRAMRQYKIELLIAFIAAVILIARRARLPWWAVLLLLAGLLVFYRGFGADFRVGNVNSLQLLALAIAFWCPPLLAGAIMGMLICFKPNLILVAMLLALSHGKKRLIRETIGGAIGAVIAVVIAMVNYGPRVWLQWIGAANEFWHRLQGRGDRNVAPLLEIYRAHGEWLAYVAAALLALAVCVALWRTKRSDDVLVAGLAIAIYLLTAPVVWLHYLVLALPLAIALLRHRVTMIISIAALLVMAEGPYEMVMDKPAFPNDAWFVGPALAVLFAAGLWMLARRSDVDPVAAR